MPKKKAAHARPARTKKAPPGMHKMPGGGLMSDATMRQMMRDEGPAPMMTGDMPTKARTLTPTATPRKPKRRK